MICFRTRLQYKHSDNHYELLQSFTFLLSLHLLLDSLIRSRILRYLRGALCSCILILIIFLLFGFSQMFRIIMAFHSVHTCSHLWRLSRLSSPTIIMIFPKIRSWPDMHHFWLFCMDILYVHIWKTIQLKALKIYCNLFPLRLFWFDTWICFTTCSP